MKKASCFLPRIALAILALTGISSAQQIVDFEDVGQSLSADSAYRGEDLAAQFISNGIRFNNSYNAGFDSWSGFAYSNRTSWNSGGLSGFEEFQFGNDTVVTSPANGSGAGFGGSDTWGVAFSFSPNDSIMSTVSGAAIESLHINNTRTTRHVIENGNAGATPFSAADEFRLILNQLDAANNVIASLDVFELAGGGSVVDDWQFVDLRGTSIEGANRIGIELTSTNTNGGGSTTPAYVAFDNIAIAVPEPSGLILGVFLIGGTMLRRRRTSN